MDHMVIALEIMGNGMAGIFTSILVIVAAVKILVTIDHLAEKKK